jgi:bacterial/archaeal transporter family protein
LHSNRDALLCISGETKHFIPDIYTLILPTALYNIFIKLGSYSIHPVLGGVILQFVAALLGLILLALQHVSQQSSSSSSSSSSLLLVSDYDTTDHDDDKDNPPPQILEYDKPGIVWSICAGVAVGAAEMLSFFVSSRGVPAVHSIPVIIGGSVFFGTVLGYALLQENLSPRGWFGVVLLVGGICLVGTD